MTLRHRSVISSSWSAPLRERAPSVHDRQLVRRRILLGILASTLAACAVPSRVPEPADLDRRVQAWWSARQAGDVATMYGMFEPSFRASTTLSEFGNEANRMRRVPIENPRIVAVSQTPNSNRATVTVVAQTKLPRTGQLVDVDIPEQWALENGQWWRVYVAPRTPFE